MNRHLPAFEFLNLIVEHEFGAVFLARQRSLDRDVAIKILTPRISADPEFRKSFEMTARTMAKLNHPNLIGVYDSGFVGGMLYFVMEFVPGKSLKHSSRGQIVEPAQALTLVNGICAGLAHAHSHGINHGDLDPHCILLNKKAEPKIGNFGFTHPAGPSETPDKPNPYAAPEVKADPSHTDPRSDIYSVGAILYGLLTGQAHGPDAKPPSSLTNCPPALDEICAKATHTDPTQRYATVDELQQALAKKDKGKTLAHKTIVPAAKKPAIPAIPADDAPNSESNPPPPVHVGTNWKLIRNIFIIIALLFAIHHAWEWRKKKTTQRAREDSEAQAKYEEEKQRAIAEARARGKKPPKTPVNPDPDQGTDPVTPDPHPIVETPRESLARLRSALASGSRNELPAGSVKMGENDYLFIAEPMSWPEAAWFAEQHGAHLAIPNIPADVTWLSKQIPGNEELWLGAGRNGRRTWSLTNGTQWKPSRVPKGTGQYLGVNKHGLLRAIRANERHPFLIQWHRDGKNPGTLNAMLTAANRSLTRAEPIYPPGTRLLENRSYYFSNRPTTWAEASEFAKQSGGHLVVTSEIGEVSILEQLAGDFSGADGIWMGGFKKGTQWTWITGEPWKTAKWADESLSESPDSALSILPGKGWQPRDPSDRSSGFIIEWSDDHKSATPVTPVTPDAPPQAAGDASDLTARAKTLIIALDKKRTDQLKDNARDYSWDLDLFLRSQSKSGQASWAPHVNALKGFADGNRVPSSIPKSSGILLSANMAKVSQQCAERQTKIDGQFLAGAEKIRSAYITKIKALQTTAQASGQRSLANSLADTLDQTLNINNWIHSFGVDPNPENPVAGLKPSPRQNPTPENPAPRNNNDPSLIE